jgi:NMD protein affecting ribosome stability and mRNA decay
MPAIIAEPRLCPGCGEEVKFPASVSALCGDCIAEKARTEVLTARFDRSMRRKPRKGGFHALV